jgi:RNA polymerase sigma-70 factor, ECF subfamily
MVVAEEIGVKAPRIGRILARSKETNPSTTHHVSHVQCVVARRMPVDRELVERARHGDREAYEVLGRLAADRLYPVAYRILRESDQADDAVQQTLVAIWREIPKLRDPDRFEAWTYRLVVRFCLAESRRQRGQEARVKALALGSRAADDTALVAVRDEIERAFRRLTPEHRAVLVLHHYVGLPVNEVAEMLGIPFGTAASRLHYAARAMRAALTEDETALTTGQLA